jgi:uncharacterized protein YbjQ (UPF0145 family)
MFCSVCGNERSTVDKFCRNCGSSFLVNSSKNHRSSGFITSTTPTIPGYHIVKILGVVTGLTPRTRGVLGKFIAGIESVFGGEVTAFTTELEKAQMEALDRARRKAMNRGANALIGLDLETSDLGSQMGVVVITATGTAVVIERDESA